MRPTRVELKVTVAKLLEVAYSKDKGMTSQIVLSKGPFKLKVDQNGHAQLSGKFGNLNFSGSPILDKIGANIKTITVNFSHGEGTAIKYHASFDLKVAKIAITGEFDIEELVTSCSGLLCQAARSMKNRNNAYDMELQRIMGH